jgi:hypothetical protein
MAESERRVLSRQWLDRRMPDQTILAQEVAAWERQRTAARCRVDWRFTMHDARIKRQRRYPSRQLG